MRATAEPKGRPGQKARTPKCGNCLILKSLVDAGLSAEVIQATCEQMSLHRVRRRQILFLEGNPPTHLFAVRSGRIKLVKTGENGREHLTGIMESGDLFGLEVLFDPAYATTAEALEDGELCLASGADLRALLAQIPGLALDLVRYLHWQLCRARERQTCVSALGAKAKLASYLLHTLSGSGDGNVACDLTLRDLGGILGLTPETVCRVLGELRNRGIVEMLPEGIRVQDRAALRLIARI